MVGFFIRAIPENITLPFKKALNSGLILIAAFSVTAYAENANYDLGSKEVTIPIVDIDGKPSLQDVILKMRSDGLMELVSFKEYKEDTTKTDSSDNNTDTDSELDFGRWYVSESVDSEDGGDNVTLALASISGAAKFGGRFIVVIRCDSGLTEFYINWNASLKNKNMNDSQDVTYKVGNAAEVTELWYNSTDNKATFYSGNTINFIKGLFNEERFEARTEGFFSSMDGVWDISGLDNAIAPLRKACSW